MEGAGQKRSNSQQPFSMLENIKSSTAFFKATLIKRYESNVQSFTKVLYIPPKTFLKNYSII